MSENMITTLMPDRYLVTIKGIRPILHNRFVTNNDKKKKKEYIPKEEAKIKLYTTEDGYPYQPATHLEGAMIEAAKRFKWEGRKTMMDLFKSSIFVSPEEIPFETPENPNNYKIDERPVVINRARVLAWRPRWDEWQLSFYVNVFQPDQISTQQLKEIISHAGYFVGIGDFRPKFGTFVVTNFEQVNYNSTDKTDETWRQIRGNNKPQ